MVVSDAQTYVLEVPDHRQSGRVIEGAVLSCAGNGSFPRGILQILNLVMQVDPKVLDEDVK